MRCRRAGHYRGRPCGCRAGAGGSRAERQQRGGHQEGACLLGSCAARGQGGGTPGSEDALDLFKEKFVDGGIAPESYAGVKDVFESLAKELPGEEREQALAYAKEFLEHIRALYSRMDSSFNFPPPGAGPPSQEGEQPDAGPALDAGPAPEVLDLKGTPCPINYVKTKLVLEELGSGAVLQVLLDEGDPVKNVPRSLKDDGHEVLGIEKQDSHYVVTVKKK